MPTEQFKTRTYSVKLPKEIYDKCDQFTKSCDTFSKAKIAPSRAKVSGIRSEVFGELTFIDHGEVSINPQSKLQLLLLYDGASSLATAYVVQNRSDLVTISHLQEHFETYQLNPKYIVADQAFMGTRMDDCYNRHNIRPISLGPGTPWPNRAEAAIRLFEKEVSLMPVVGVVPGFGGSAGSGRVEGLRVVDIGTGAEAKSGRGMENTDMGRRFGSGFTII